MMIFSVPVPCHCQSRRKSAVSCQRSTCVEEAKNCASRSTMARSGRETLLDSGRPGCLHGQEQASNPGGSEESSRRADRPSDGLGHRVAIESECLRGGASVPVARGLRGQDSGGLPSRMPFLSRSWSESDDLTAWEENRYGEQGPSGHGPECGGDCRGCPESGDSGLYPTTEDEKGKALLVMGWIIAAGIGVLLFALWAMGVDR